MSVFSQAVLIINIVILTFSAGVFFTLTVGPQKRRETEGPLLISMMLSIHALCRLMASSHAFWANSATVLAILFWLLGPYIQRLRIRRKTPRWLMSFLALMTMVHTVVAFHPALEEFWRPLLWLLWALAMFSSVLFPLLHLSELPYRILRLPTALSHFLILALVLVNLPPLALSLFLPNRDFSRTIHVSWLVGLFLLGSYNAVLLWILLREGARVTSTVPKLTPELIEAYELNRRERDIVDLLLEGYTAKAIALKVCLSHQTVKNYIQRMYRRTGVNNRVEFINLFHTPVPL